MWRVYAISGAALIVLSCIFSVFAYIQANDERLSLTSDLQYRTRVLADSLEESITPSLSRSEISSVQRIVDRIADNERIFGVVLSDTKGIAIAQSGKTITQEAVIKLAASVMDSAKPDGIIVKENGISVYVLATPLTGEDDQIIGALQLAQNAQYIDEGILGIWKENLIRLLTILIFVALTLTILFRVVFKRQVAHLANALRDMDRGAIDSDNINAGSMFGPLAAEISRVTRSLQQARKSASEEARLRLEEHEAPWTAHRLQEFMRAYMKNRQIFVISNREPYVHNHGKKGIECSVPAHGMVTAIDAMMRACGGMWIAHGSGSADMETADSSGLIRVPTEEPHYTLKRIWLSEEEVRGHYVGFSNEALFPLCLMTHTRPVFRPEDWATYRRVNAKFAEALLAEIKNVEQPLILVQDLHFALVPAIIKKSRPDAQVALFWHHPWPSPEQFSICPWRKEILAGMLGADVIGFHIQQHCNNFIETIGKELEARIDYEQFAVTTGGHTTLVRPFPISIPFTNNAEPKKHKDEVPFKRFGVTTPLVALGVDRLDYTKGIIERLRGIEHFFEKYPAYRKQLTFLQVAAPSREAVEKYREYSAQVDQEIKRINGKLQTNSWSPIVYVRRHVPHEELRPLYREANACLVTSLHDGMNLVAKEYIAESENLGVLILSAFTGAARELTAALIINPYSPEEIANALHRALTMPESEKYRRMKALRQTVSSYNVYRWAGEFIQTLARTTSLQ